MSEIPCPLWHAALRHPNDIALAAGARTLTYSEYNAHVSAAVNRLREYGIAAGDRVALIGPNSIAQVIAFMAVIRLGAIACPISFRFPSDTVYTLFDRLKLKLVLFDGTDHARPLANDRAAPLSDLVNLSDPAAPVTHEHSVSLSRYNYATIVLTSGSSGEPKAALHCYANHYYSALGSNENIKLVPGDRWLMALPLFHVGGIAILFRCLLAGATVVIEPKFSGAEPLPEGRLTHLSLVPTQVKRLLDDPASMQALARTKAILIGGAPMSEVLLEEAYDARWPIHTTYGMTETSSQLTTSEPGSPLAQLYTSGKVLPHRTVSISPDGEILAAGETLFVGYVGVDCIERAVDEDGWFHTGDLGQIDNLGNLTVSGRRDNMFISGGENVQPEAIERALRRLDGVEDALVVPVTDEEFGERPFAFLQLASLRQIPQTKTGRSLELMREEIVARWCQSPGPRTAIATELPRYMIPVMCAAWPLPSRERLKPDRGQLRELAERIYRGQT